MRGKLAVPALLAAVAGIVLVGCGGGGGNSGTTTTESTATQAETESGSASGGKALQITMSDFAFSPENATAKAGKTRIEAPNEGSVEHELVIFKTNMNPAELPTEASGGVDEEKLDQIAEEAGEIPDVEPGETKSEEFKLTPGKYVMFCNIPGHYADHMYGTITVAK